MQNISVYPCTKIKQAAVTHGTDDSNVMELTLFKRTIFCKPTEGMGLVRLTVLPFEDHIYRSKRRSWSCLWK